MSGKERAVTVPSSLMGVRKDERVPMEKNETGKQTGTVPSKTNGTGKRTGTGEA